MSLVSVLSLAAVWIPLLLAGAGSFPWARVSCSAVAGAGCLSYVDFIMLVSPVICSVNINY